MDSSCLFGIMVPGRSRLEDSDKEGPFHHYGQHTQRTSRGEKPSSSSTENRPFRNGNLTLLVPTKRHVETLLGLSPTGSR